MRSPVLTTGSCNYQGGGITTGSPLSSYAPAVQCPVVLVLTAVPGVSGGGVLAERSSQQYCRSRVSLSPPFLRELLRFTAVKLPFRAQVLYVVAFMREVVLLMVPFMEECAGGYRDSAAIYGTSGSNCGDSASVYGSSGSVDILL